MQLKPVVASFTCLSLYTRSQELTWCSAYEQEINIAVYGQIALKYYGNMYFFGFVFWTWLPLASIVLAWGAFFACILDLEIVTVAFFD